MNILKKTRQEWWVIQLSLKNHGKCILVIIMRLFHKLNYLSKVESISCLGKKRNLFKKNLSNRIILCDEEIYQKT